MNQETLRMSRRERERLVVMRRYERGEMLLKEAAWEMRVSVRQAIRIKKRFQDQGAQGLIHSLRDMPSKRACDPELRRRALEVYQARYGDFGPTLACEKMAEHEGIEVNRETLRRWLIAQCLWRVGAKGRVHRRKRKRRERFGQMLQIDGSDHAWFEERAPKSTLMVLIDDATGKMALHMARAETTAAALRVLGQWVQRHGVPASLYADQRTTYFTQEFLHEPGRREDPRTFTRFMRVTERLGIDMIPAYSPQAKGRVERANGLLQDRLVKEFRLRGIDTIQAANAMLASFAQEMNRRFAKEPARPADAHRAAPGASGNGTTSSAPKRAARCSATTRSS
jgi:transposase